MSTKIPTREEALSLFKRYNETDSLNKHALAVEAVMRHFAELFNEDAEKWGIIGLVHDLDYEKYPEEHCTQTKKILEDESWPEDYIRAVLSHGYGICTEVEPQHTMEKVLYCIDELTGLVTATALVRPSKSLMDMKVKSVKKKWNTRSFAAGANREIIKKGAEMLGKDLSYMIQETIEGMKKVAPDLELDGRLAG
ncbi:MAG: HD domain-containing protein [Bacteroidota bacterium]